VVTVQGDTVSVNLAPFIQTVKQRLVASGFGLAAQIPEVNASFALFQSADITRARSAFNLLNTLGIWLPIIAIVLLSIGVYVAKDRRRALVGAAVGVAVGMLVLALSLAVFRTIYLDALPPQVLPHDAAAVLYDTIVRYLRLGLRTVLVLALLVAAGALVTGPSTTAVRTRQRVAAAIGRLRGGAEHAGLHTGPVGTWGLCQQAAPAHRRGHPGRAGAGVLGPADRQDRPAAGRAAAGRPRPDRVPWAAIPTHRRHPHNQDVNPAPLRLLDPKRVHPDLSGRAGDARTPPRSLRSIARSCSPPLHPFGVMRLWALGGDHLLVPLA
jgi:hypothetical protein